MLSNIETQRFILHANIVRYKKILATFLTDQERCFVERRLAEDRESFQQLVRGIVFNDKWTYAA